MTRLSVEEVSKRFGERTVLSGVSFDVEPGEAVTIIGPSGCGKTTLLRLILGEMQPDEGRILFDGEPVESVRIEHRGVGIVYQGYALFPHLSALDNVAYGLRVRGVGRRAARARALELLGLVELESSEGRFPHELSGGERQRVALARALAVNPRVLLLDEAFAALDASTRGSVAADVRRIIKKLGVTTLLVTHDQEEAFTFGDRVLVLSDEGRLVACGPPHGVMAEAHPFVRTFVKMLMISDARVRHVEEGWRVELPDGTCLPVRLPNLGQGDHLHVVVKRGFCVPAGEAKDRHAP